MSNNSYYNDQWRIINESNQNKVSNYSCEFDGTSDFITISNPTELTNDFTISAWVFPTRVDSSYEMIYTQGTATGGGTVQPYFAVRDTKLHVYINAVYETGLNFITADEWQHVAVTRTSGVLNLYRNGVEYNGTRPTQNGTINNNSAGVIGKWAVVSSPNYFKGKIDQTCIFDYALPATGTNSIATIYGGGTTVTNPMGLSPKPISYYQLGDQSVDNGANLLVPNNSLSDYVFNFSNDEINLGNSSSFTFGNAATDSPFSVSFWINPNSISTGTTGFFQKGTDSLVEYGILFYLNKIRFRLKSYNEANNGFQISIDETAATALVAGSWSHVVVTYDGTGGSTAANGMEMYINGNPITVTRTNNGGYVAMRNKGSDLFIASRGGLGYVGGKFSNFAVFNTELDQTKVTNLYNNGSPSTDISSLNPTAWYKLNAQDTFNGTNWTIKDYAGTNNGTSSGMNSANLIVSDLQHTSGYSPYAITLDGTGQVFNLNSEILLPDNKTVSFWFKLRVVPSGQFAIPLSSSNNRYYPLLQNSGGNFFIYLQGDNGVAVINTFLPVQAGVWYNFIITGDGTTPLLYINNVVYSFGSQSDRTEVLIGDIGARPNGSFDLDGDMSNVAIWSGTTLSSTEVTEVYNQGVPSNLNTFSGTKPTAWWQLGSNSSFNSATSQWTCLDEIGTNNAASSTNMANDDITNGVGYSANGLGTSSIDIIGNAPYSSGNGLSENMDVLDRVKDTPPT